jgi:acetylornithine deacetylase
VELVEFEAGRGNVLLTYPGNGKSGKCVSFVGSHLDVVPADPTVWERPPFKLIIEGDKLYGRGTTDCLGHVALITCLFRALAILKPDLDIDVHAVFIASEEAEAKVR